VCVIIFFQALIVVYNSWSKEYIKSTVLSILGTAILALTNVLVLSPVYFRIARILTEYENYKSQPAFQNALNVKMFILSFINSFSSLIYLGIIKAMMSQGGFGVWNPADGIPKIPQCGFTSDINTCLSEVTVQMAIMFLGLQFVYQLTEIIIP
ncbi:Anoctamin-7, partial [Nowakowskiella sp. JEL0078]